MVERIVFLVMGILIGLWLMGKQQVKVEDKDKDELILKLRKKVVYLAERLTAECQKRNKGQ